MNLKKKYQSMSVQARAGIWFVLCSFLQKGISFLTVPIFTRLLTSDEYGTYSLYLSWFQILTIITSLNLFNGVLDNGMSKFEKDRDRFISSMQGLAVTITTVVFIVYCLLFEFWSGLIGLAPMYISMMFVEMYMTPSFLFWSGKQRFEYHYKRLVFVTLAKSVLNPVLGLIMVFTFSDRALGRVVSVIAVETLFSAVIMFVQFAKGKVFFDSFYWTYGLKLAIPMLPHYLSGIILNQGDRIMIEKIVNKSAVAYYSVAYSIGMLVQIFTTAINSAITPWVYQKMKDKSEEGVSKTINTLLFFVAGMCVCLMLVSPELMIVFGDVEYIQGAQVIPPVAASVYFIFLYFIFSMPQFYFEKTGFLFPASAGSAILNVILNYVFIHKYGYVAAGYTTLACYVLFSIGHYVVSIMVLKKNMEGKKFFDIKTITIISIFVIIAGICINALFDYPIIRYLIVAICCVVVYLRKDYIIRILTKKGADI